MPYHLSEQQKESSQVKLIEALWSVDMESSFVAIVEVEKTGAWIIISERVVKHLVLL